MSNILAISGLVVREMIRRKDFYVLFVLTTVITVLLGGLNFFNEAGIVRALKEVCLLLIWISGLVIAVTTSARQIPAERENRTLMPLLAKPISRGHYVMGKFLGSWLATGLALACFYIFFILMSGLREGHWPVAEYLQAVWLHWLMLGMVSAFCIWGSLTFAAPSSNLTITLVLVFTIQFLGEYLDRLAASMGGLLGMGLAVIYYVMPHLELFDVRTRIIHGVGPVAWGAWLAATPYAALYMAIFLLAAGRKFQRISLSGT